VGSTYLARITGLCSDVAVKLAAASPRDEKALKHSLPVALVYENNCDSRDAYTPVRQSRVPRDGDHHVELVASVQGMADQDAIDGFEFATFVRELDALRLRMVGASFFESIGSVSLQITTDDARSGVSPSLHNAEHGLAQGSMQDAVASAVLLLNNHDDMARRRR
jgi:hypothetical protein